MMEKLDRFLAIAAKRQDIVFALFFVMIVIMLIIPMPTVLIDIFIAFNVSMALMVLISATYLKDVLQFSTFPSLILVSTIFRVALTVSTARLILSKGDAGHLVEGFGEFVVGGNLVVGMVIFFVVALVQFMVINKGAERIAEVSARFTLDALPGKQMAIDADLRAGELTKEEARKRRFNLEKESQFFGSMDGAMRFVKGDTMASLIVFFINLIAGMIIGMAQRGLPFDEALRTYSKLSVGDALVAQIPAMLMAVAAGAIVTRVSMEDSKQLGADIAKQVAADPRAVTITGGVCFFMAFLPGFPTLVFLGISLVLFSPLILGYLRRRGKPAEAADSVPTTGEGVEGGEAAAGAEAGGSDLLPASSPGELFTIDLPAAVRPRLEAAGLATAMSQRLAAESERFGFRLPTPGFRTSQRNDLIRFLVEGTPTAGMPIEELPPVPAICDFIVAGMSKDVSRAFDVDTASAWLKSLQPSHTRLITDVEQTVTILLVVDVGRDLLDDGLTLAQPRPILETLLRAQRFNGRVTDIVDAARQLMRRAITNQHRDKEGIVPVVLLAPDVEPLIRTIMVGGDQSGMDVKARDVAARRFAAQVKSVFEKEWAKGSRPVLAVATDLRRPLKRFLIGQGMEIPLVGLGEIDPDGTIKPVAMLSSLEQRAA